MRIVLFDEVGVPLGLGEGFVGGVRLGVHLGVR